MFNFILLLLALWLKPRFQTNDDIGMIYAYSGTAIFDIPTAVTAFSTKVWGILMVCLYRIFPNGMEVYTIALFLFIYFSNVIIYIKLFEKLSYKNPLFWLILISVLSFITINFYLELQFTMVAGLLCFTSVLLVFNQPKKSDKNLSYIFIAFSILLRPSIIPIFLAFLFILNFGISYILPELVQPRRQILKIFGIFILIFTSVYFIDKEIHTEKEKHFLDFNLYRGGIVDFNFEKSTNSSLPTNWGKEELFLFKNWFYNDTFLYNNSREYKIVQNGLGNGFIDKMKLRNINLIVILYQFKNPLFRCILILSILLLFFVRQWKRNLVILLFVILLYFIFYNFLSIFLKVPPFRVSFILFSSGMLLYLCNIIKMIDAKSALNSKFIISGFFILYGLWITKISMEFRYRDIINSKCIERYSPNLIYIRWANFPFEMVDPFKVSASLHKIKIINMGAFSVHPAVQNVFGNFKYKNLTEDIIGKEEIVSFVMPRDTSIWEEFRNAYCAFIFKHYKRKVNFLPVKNSKHCYDYMEFKLIEEFNAKLD